MNLSRALRVARDSRVALVGAGGKTTALFQLARDLGGPVLVTTSTHLGAWQINSADRHWIVTRPEDVERFAGQIEGVTLFTGPQVENQRVQGLGAVDLDAVKDMAELLGFPVLIEADGSRQRPIKAPGEAEPAIPEWVDQVIVTAGLSGLGRPLDEGVVHRPALFEEISGLNRGEPISEEGLARVLTHPEGGMKNIPAGVRKVLLLNQADQAETAAAGLRIANQVIGEFDSVVVAALEQRRIWSVVEPAAGVILAAGGSSRYGQAKMLLPWRGKPLVRHAAEAALAGGLSPVVAVLGAEHEGVRQALAGLPVGYIENPDWLSGQSSSVRLGTAAVGERAGAAVFLLADQPFVSPELIQQLVKSHQENLSPVVAPRVEGMRANPVLFDRDTFLDLIELEGDTGGRAIFDRFEIAYVDWADPRLLMDVDTPEDYRRLQEME